MRMKKNTKKFLAVTLSATMVMGMGMTAMAGAPDPTPTPEPTPAPVEVEAPIYSYDVTNVIVPTTYKVAFNPDGLTVKTGASDTSTDQIVSKNYGIINKSTKDKVVTVTLTVEDKNDGKITFVNSADEVTSAEKDTYAIYLAAVPADTTGVKAGTAAIDKATAASALDDVAMTPATAKAVALGAGENVIGFKLDKATYDLKTGQSIELGSTAAADIVDKFEVSALAADGKGVTAFTFTGSMNSDADWTKVTSGIKITAVYKNETAAGDETVLTGTGAMVEVVSAPKFTTGSDVGTISYTAGKGDDALKTIKSITMDYTGTPYDGYNALAGAWAAA